MQQPLRSPSVKPDVVIRHTRASEAELLPEVERSAGEAFRSVPGLAWVADDDVLGSGEHRRLAEAGTSWVALVGVRPIGFVCAERFGRDLHIQQIAVRTEAQGQGIGRGLMRVVLEHAIESGAASVTLTTFRELPFNEGFYLDLGFQTLEEGGLDDRLRQTLADEARAGFPATQRCAMQLRLGRQDRT